MTSTSNSALFRTFTVDARTFVRVVLAGLAGLILWEFFGRLIAPLWIGEPLDATPLIEMALGIKGGWATLVHILTGLVAYPLGYVMIVRPIGGMIVPRHMWPVLGLAYGVALWVFAMFVIASLMAGMPPFLGFQQIAWASLVGHVALALGIAGATQYLLPAN
jgi:hypothetical protein